MHRTAIAATPNRTDEFCDEGSENVQQTPRRERHRRAMKEYRFLALTLARPAAMALVALLLIFVVLPAALGAQASIAP